MGTSDFHGQQILQNAITANSEQNSNIEQNNRKEGFIDKELADLNAPQRQGVLHEDGPLLILAGAGSGKTRVLTRRIVHLIKNRGVRSEEILAVTFTNKAANEMRERLAKMLTQSSSLADNGYHNSKNLWITTFHSAGLKILRKYAAAIGYPNDFVVYDAQDTNSLMKRILKDLNVDPKKFPPSLFLHYIDQQKNNYRFPHDLISNSGKTEGHGYEQKLKLEIYEKYQLTLKKNAAVDFGDLLMLSLKLLIDNPNIARSYQHQLRYILVDEFQDTNIVQYKLVQLLSKTHNNLLVVGDDDQSIYSFRGASIENIRNFEKDFTGAKVVKLEQNYRSTGNILEVAHSVIKSSLNRKNKKLWTASEPGESITTFVGEDETDEAYFIAGKIRSLCESGTKFSDVAIFYRTNAQSRAIEEIFTRLKIPYKIFGGLKFYDRKEIKDVIAFLRLLVNQSDTESLLRIINTPPRGIGEQAIYNLTQIAQQENITVWEAAVHTSVKHNSIRKFVTLIETLRRTAERSSLSDLIGEIIKSTGFADYLNASNDPTSQSRLENLKELQGMHSNNASSTGLEPIREFLDNVSLTSSGDIDAEGAQKENNGFVSMMTLHLAKGLEFPVVFFTGLEEGLLPHARSTDDVSVDEERRLCYVGITRAREKLFITRTKRRSLFAASSGSGYFRTVSRFAMDIPDQLLTELNGDFKSCSLSENSEDFEFEDFSSEKYNSYSNQKKSFVAGKIANVRRTLNKSLVKTADEFLTDNEQDIDLAELESLQPGIRVKHPTFGLGTVAEVLNLAGPDTKLSIQFDSEKLKTKQLIYRYAKLSLI